jgi:hydrogenase nickel incorporation protein HypB
MCATCGCSGETHPHGHGHAPATHQHAPAPRRLTLEQQVLARNDRQAARNRLHLATQGVRALNLMSSPGAGKTSLLERTVRDLGGELPFQVIEGDQETDRDARRLRETGCAVVQLNTGTGCHLDAEMVERGLAQLALAEGSVLFIENVGNLVCPALFDLGEDERVVLSAVTEGEDKPLKYPHMFRAATLVLLNKVDLLPYVDFDPGRFVAHLREVNPRLPVLALSVSRGDGMEDWYRWLRGIARRGVA